MNTDGKNIEEHQNIRNMLKHNMPNMHIVLPEGGVLLQSELRL